MTALTCRALHLLSSLPRPSAVPAALSRPASIFHRCGLGTFAPRPSLSPPNGYVSPMTLTRHFSVGGGWAVNELEEKLWAAAHAVNPASRDDFLKFLRKSEVIVPAQNGPNTTPKLDGGDDEGNVRVVTFEDAEGGNWLPVFTSLDRYEAWIGEVPAAQNVTSSTIEFEFLLGLMVLGTEGSHNMALNPGSDCGVSFSPEELVELRNSPRDNVVTIASGTQVLLGELEIHPQELVDALSRCFSGHPKVRAGYVRGISYQDSPDKVSTLIAIDVDTAAFLAIKEDIRAAILSVDNIPNRPVDFAPLEALRDTLPGSFDGDLEPFYTRAAK